MACNQAGNKGYVPSNYIEVYASVPREESSEYSQSYRQTQYSRQNSVSNSGQVVKQVSVESSSSWGVKQASVESNSSWGVPATQPSMPPIPESGAPVGLTTDEEDSDEDDLPPGNITLQPLISDALLLLLYLQVWPHLWAPHPLSVFTSQTMKEWEWALETPGQSRLTSGRH